MTVVPGNSSESDASPPPPAAFTPDEVAEMVLAARARVTRAAARHPRFDGLTPDDVEDLFDATSEIVVRRHARYASDDHVRASLWHGMELRARDVFRRRRRRGQELDPEILEHVSDDTEDLDERIARDQTLLVVRDFLAALTPREAEVWKLIHGEELSVLATSKHLAISRHAVSEHLDSATRKLETFAAIANAGEWCGRRQADISRMLDGVDEAGTVRRALAHLDACAVCRRANAKRVRETGRIAAGVLPAPAFLLNAHGRGLIERLAEMLPQSGGGGRGEMVAGTVLGGGGVAGLTKVGAVVATTVAIGAGGMTLRADREDTRTGAPPKSGKAVAAGRAPAPGGARRDAASAPPQTAPATTRRAGTAPRPRPSAQADREVFSLGTVEPAGAPPAPKATQASRPIATSSSPAAGEGSESFLP